jgi:hypothetical protein
MRKISKARSFGLNRNALDADLRDTRPLRIPGATITSWPGSPDIDLDLLFGQPAAGPTVAGAIATDAGRIVGTTNPAPNPGTVSLSDGTRITFATVSQFDTVE